MRSLDIESQRNGHLEWIDAHGLVVGTHIEEKSLFIGQMIVVFKSIVHEARGVCQGS